MTFHPAMRAELRGIRALEPLRYRAWQGVVADLWRASGVSGGGGYYVSPHPRIVLFLDDGAAALELAGAANSGRGLAALYVPAEVPITSRMLQDSSFAHVDLHLQGEAFARRIAGLRLGRDPRLPHFLTDGGRLRPLAGLIADELVAGRRPDLLLEGLLLATLTEVFEALPDVPAQQRPRNGGLTPRQMAAVDRLFRDAIDRHLTVADLAAATGLSESWFAHAFKLSTGESPQRWQMRRRVEVATRMIEADPARPLAEIAAATGFSDQAHFSRAFRTERGQPPATWRRGLVPRAFPADPFK